MLQMVTSSFTTCNNITREAPNDAHLTDGDGKGNLITCSSHTSRKQSSCDLNQRCWSHVVKSVALYIAKKPPKLNIKWFCIPQQRRLLGK